MSRVKTRALSCALLAVVFLAVAGASQAQYLGPGEMSADTKVSQVMKKPIDGQQVVLQGRITKKFGRQHYEFTDDTGAIRTKIDNRLFYNLKVTDKTIVELFGEVNKRLTQSPEIDVFHIRVIAP